MSIDDRIIELMDRVALLERKAEKVAEHQNADVFNEGLRLLKDYEKLLLNSEGSIEELNSRYKQYVPKFDSLDTEVVCSELFNEIEESFRNVVQIVKAKHKIELPQIKVVRDNIPIDELIALLHEIGGLEEEKPLAKKQKGHLKIWFYGFDEQDYQELVDGGVKPTLKVHKIDGYETRRIGSSEELNKEFALAPPYILYMHVGLEEIAGKNHSFVKGVKDAFNFLNLFKEEIRRYGTRVRLIRSFKKGPDEYRVLSDMTAAAAGVTDLKGISFSYGKGLMNQLIASLYRDLKDYRH